MDDRDILETLKAELDFVEKGGYGRSVKTPWQHTSIFQDSLSCLNFADPKRPHPCEECFLMQFVSREHRSDSVPCHHISLNEKGETIQSLEERGDEEYLQETVKTWLKEAIKKIEERQTPSVSA